MSVHIDDLLIRVGLIRIEPGRLGLTQQLSALLFQVVQVLEIGPDLRVVRLNAVLDQFKASVPQGFDIQDVELSSALSHGEG